MLFCRGNRRHDDHREDLSRYVVRARRDLRDRIVSFFEVNPLRTAKAVSVPGILRGHTPATSAPTAEVKIWSEPHGDMGINSSEIPCRVNSCPTQRRLCVQDPLITAKPYPSASRKDEATGGG